MQDQKIPPRSEWFSMSVTQLYQVKSDMVSLAYGMRGAGASCANTYMKFVSELDALIARKTAEQESNQD